MSPTIYSGCVFVCGFSFFFCKRFHVARVHFACCYFCLCESPEHVYIFVLNIETGICQNNMYGSFFDWLISLATNHRSYFKDDPT